MFKTILRNYRNAGKQVSVGFLMGKPDGTADTIFEHKASALAIHNLASEGHRHLLKQAMKVSYRLPPEMKFSDVAWPVATLLLVKEAHRLKTCGPSCVFQPIVDGISA